MKTRSFQDVQVGEALPELVVSVTTTMVIGGALASRDFTPVHHDKAAAQASGLSDIIMNTATTNCFVSRYVTDWTGPDAVIRGISLKLGAPNTAGETMKMAGTVKAKHEQDSVVEVEVAATNSWGDHASGVVKVALPTA